MVTAVLLAAGTSRRMGRLKALIKLGHKTILQHALANLEASQVNEIVVVLGFKAEKIIPTLKGMRCQVVVNPQYTRGMSSSIRCGLSAVNPQARAVLIALGDQPYIPPEIVDLLLRSYQEEDQKIVVPTCGGRRGHPVIFGRRYWPELRALKGDVGCKELLRRHAQHVLEVEVFQEGVLADIDTPSNGRKRGF
jgi:molybdenum cofactor cytidylyltransferase